MSDANAESDVVSGDVIAGGAIEAIERAQIDMQIATAKRYPRDIAKVRQGIISMATLDQETAEACFYSVPRGGKTIQGPGVRMAEIAVHQFGNVRVQTRLIDAVVSGDSPHVTVQAVCADLEKNVAVSIEKRRRITGKKSKGGRIDEDDINLAVNACSAIAFRDAAFKVVPGALIKPAFDAAKSVAIGDAKTLETRRAYAVARFAKLGVDEKRVLSAIGKSGMDAVDLNDLETLFGLFTAIRDGQVTIEQAFPATTQEVAKPAEAPSSLFEPKNGGKHTKQSVTSTTSDLHAEIAALIESATPKKVRDVMTANGIKIEDGDAWEMADEAKLKAIRSMLKC